MLALLIMVALGDGHPAVAEGFKDLLELPSLEPDEASAQEPETAPWPLYLQLGARVGGMYSGNEPETALQVDPETGVWRTDDLLQPRPQHGYGSLAFQLGLEAELASVVMVRGLFDTGELRLGSSYEPPLEGIACNARPALDELRSGAMLRELAIDWTDKGISVAFGRTRMRVAQGLVYDDFGTGASLQLDFGAMHLWPWRVQAMALMVGRRWEDFDPASPLISLHVAYDFSLLESVGLFGALFVDRGGALQEVLLSSVAESAMVQLTPELQQVTLTRLFGIERESQGKIGYLGLSGNLIPLRSLSLHATVVLSLGTVWTRLGPDTEQTLRLRSWAGEVEAHYGVNEMFDVGALAFALSGDEPPRLPADTPTYGSFVAVAPYWVWTGLFFSGGLNQGFYAERAAAAGVNGHGVLGLGPTLQLTLDCGYAEARLVYLHALVEPPPPPLGGHNSVYGVELDLVQSFQLWSFLSVALETDVLFPGGFFPGGKPAYRVIGLLDVHWAV